MKKSVPTVPVIEVPDQGLVRFLGQNVLVYCGNYIYNGTLTGVNTDCIELTDPAIVYETGKYTDSQLKDRQALPAKQLLVMIGFIESIFPYNK